MFFEKDEDTNEDSDSEMIFEPEPDEAEGLVRQRDPRLKLAPEILKQVNESIGHVVDLLEGGNTEDARNQLVKMVTTKKGLEESLEDISSSRTIEGVFNGEVMIGSDGKSYAVPPNYASKSRLVEGDMLKLTIRSDGSFVFKQIGPIERDRLVGRLAFDASCGSHVVIVGDDEIYKVLNASVTFFKGEPGDNAVILVPKHTPSAWAAVENVVKK